MIKPEAKRVPEALPSFLDGGTTSVTDPSPITAAIAIADADDETTGATAPANAETTTSAGAAAPAPGSAAIPDAPALPAAPSRHGAAAILLGIVVLLAALATLLVPSCAAALTASGIPANALFVLGTLLLVAGALQRHIGRLQQRLDEAEQRRQHDATAVQQDLQQLVAGKHDAGVLGGEGLQQVLLTLQRQDEKINNLTKAIKMYGKPLVEIAEQGTELAGGVAAVKTLVEGGSELVRQGLQRLESQLRTPGQPKELIELQHTLQKLAAARPGVDLAPLQQQLGRVESAVADRRVHEGLARLEQASEKSREAVLELMRGDAVQAAAMRLQEQLDQATRRLADALVQIRDGNTSCLENGRDLQRTMAAVTATIAQIGASLKAGTVAAPAAIPPAPAGNTTSATPNPGATAPAAATAPGTANATETGTAYQAGARTTASKNVLGAIAKLKQMKG